MRNPWIRFATRRDIFAAERRFRLPPFLPGGRKFAVGGSFKLQKQASSRSKSPGRKRPGNDRRASAPGIRGLWVVTT